jgi:anti-sigma factor RsiW
VTDWHPSDALSGFLDDELPHEEALVVRRHLDSCSFCRLELEEVAEARAWIRGLPPVDHPATFPERVVRVGRQPAVARRRGLLAMVATAAAAVAVVGFVRPAPSRVEPPVPQLVERHAAAASVTGDPLTELAPAGIPVVFRP